MEAEMASNVPHQWSLDHRWRRPTVRLARVDEEFQGILKRDFALIESLRSFALVKQASDRRIIDPAGTSHAKKKANVFRQIRVTKMSPQMSNLMIYGSTESQISAEKQRFFGNFSFFGLSRR